MPSSVIRQTCVFATEADQRIYEKYVDPSDSNWVKKNFLSRVSHLTSAPVFLSALTLKTLAGAAAGFAAIINGLNNPDLLKFASKNIQYSNRILNVPFAHLLKAVNPQAEIGKSTWGTVTSLMIPLKKTVGIFTEQCQKSENPIVKHVASRLPYLLMPLVAIVVRLADGIIGVLAALFALLTAGLYPKLNQVAYTNLTAPGLISDLFHLTVLFIDPSKKLMKYEDTAPLKLD